MINPVPINDPIDLTVKALVQFFTQNMPELNQVIDDFPNPNENLLFPALSITHDANNGFSNLIPYEEVLDTVSNGRADVLWIVGEWDFNIQLDFWGRNRVERDQLFSHFFNVFNKNINPMGLSLQLKEYYNLWVRYDIAGYQHKDGEEASQRQEWRTMVKILTHCKHALIEKNYIITYPVLNLGLQKLNGSNT